MKKSFIAIAIISGIVIGAIIGFGGLSALSHTGASTTTGSANTIITKPDGMISTVDAKSIILNKVPGAILMNFDFTTGDLPVYDATVVNGKNEYNIKVNAKTGDISSFTQESSNFSGTMTDVNSSIVSENGFISTNKARDIASVKVPNANVVGVTLNYQGITPEYDLILSTSSTKNYICINAKTGDIISNTSMLD